MYANDFIKKAVPVQKKKKMKSKTTSYDVYELLINSSYNIK